MLKDNSKDILPGDTFIAINGTNDGHKYINEAIKNGATNLIVEYGSYEVDTKIVPNTKEYLINYLENKYKGINKTIIGITGTNGKTTTAYLLYQALNKVSSCSYIGTIGYYNNNEIININNTTPGLIDLYKYIYENDSKYVVLEVSSHAIDQRRIGNIKFDYLIYTNITQDHLDYHKTMENYFNTKLKLLNNLKENGKVIINEDDNFLRSINHNQTVFYGKNNPLNQIKNISFDTNRQKFIFNDIKYTTYLLGEHNIYNLIPTILILNDLKTIDISNIIEKLSPPPGRMEIINNDTNKIIIDYAHTPDAVEKIIKSVKAFAKNDIYVIIGCGGNRDKSKRIIMSTIATNEADYAIFTSDNPRNEDINDIIKDMTNNLINTNYEIEIDREKAIIKGIQKLKKNDILIILGKGHETYQILKDKTIHFSDYEIVIKNL